MRVSIVMPAYNASRFLAAALDSIVAQTHEDFELILIDDGSTDDTGAIAAAYAADDARITVVSRENRGLCASLNEGIDGSRTTWVAIMHADDVMEPNRIERQIAYLAEHPDLDVVSSFVYYIDHRGQRIGTYVSELIDASRVEQLYSRNEVIGFHHPAVMLRKSVVEAVGGYRQPFWPCEDIDLWNRIVEHGYAVRVQPEFLMSYRLHGSSASTSGAWLLRLKHRWVEQCIVARRSGRPEPSWDAFLAYRAGLPPWTRLNQTREDLGKVLYKAAVLSYAERRLPSLALTLLGAALLEPVYVFNQVKSKYGTRRAPSNPSGRATDAEMSST